MEDLYQVGAITQTHGIKGEVKVFPLTDDISRFKNMKNLLLDGGRDGYINLEVENVRQQKNLVILKFKGIDNINDIEKYKGHGLFVTKENRVELKEDEYFIADLIGVSVYLDTDENTVFGEITDVLQTGANDVYQIWNAQEQKEYLAPAIPEVILETNLQTGIMKIRPLKGLFENAG